MATPEQISAAKRRLRVARAQAALAAKREQPSMAWGDVFSGAAANLGPSAKQYGADIVRPFTHPKETASALWTLAQGVAHKLTPGEQPSEAAVDALVKHFSDRYGGIEAAKRTFSQDPVGFLGDASTVLLAGGPALALAPGKLGKLGAAAGKAGAAVDPLSVAGTVVGKTAGTAGTVGAHALGWTTGAKGESVKRAWQTGRAGGERALIFRDEMRGNVPMDTAVAEAKQAVSNLYQARSETYKMGLKRAIGGKDKTLSFEGLGKAIEKVDQVSKFKNIELSPQTAGVRAEIKDLVAKWYEAGPEYHTAAGFDALKKAIGNVREAQEWGSPSRKVANDVYQSVVKEITRQAPEYAAVMKEYWRASEELSEVERALSLGRKASAEQGLRKLQSIVRNDVSSAYGRRRELAGTLEGAGANRIMDRMAGQAMSSALPRGLANVTPAALMSNAVPLGLASGGGFMGAGAPGLALALMSTSPRLVGEAVHGAGRVAGAVDRVGAPVARAVAPAVSPLARALSFQAGRAGREEQDRRPY